MPSVRRCSASAMLDAAQAVGPVVSDSVPAARPTHVVHGRVRSCRPGAASATSPTTAVAQSTSALMPNSVYADGTGTSCTPGTVRTIATLSCPSASGRTSLPPARYTWVPRTSRLVSTAAVAVAVSRNTPGPAPDQPDQRSGPCRRTGASAGTSATPSGTASAATAPQTRNAFVVPPYAATAPPSSTTRATATTARHAVTTTGTAAHASVGTRRRHTRAAAAIPVRTAPSIVGATSIPTYDGSSPPGVRRALTTAEAAQTSTARTRATTASVPFQRGGVTWIPASSLRSATTAAARATTAAPATSSTVPAPDRSSVHARSTATSATAAARCARRADGPATRRLQKPARYSSGPVPAPTRTCPARARETRSSNRTWPARATATSRRTTRTGTSESRTTRSPWSVRARPSSSVGTREHTSTVVASGATTPMHRVPTTRTVTVVTAAVSRSVRARPKTRTAAAVASGRARSTVSSARRAGVRATSPSSAPGTRRAQYATFARPNGTLRAHRARVSPRPTAPTTPESGNAPSRAIAPHE
ncbi:hypothetical protein [Cellulosimicrobium sp. Marseille-Q8652]